jgi:hypothetical protein
VLRWVCTSNPFYVISAGLFLAGLWVSFGSQERDEDAWALMAGLAGYTLLLAATAFLLVRFARVWDDARTVLLLVVLMFLATSVTFDGLLALDPGRGFLFYAAGLLFAAAVSEGLLRGIGLTLPGWYRAAYYAILALFFLYPLALVPLLARPRSEALMWGLFGFSPAAGLVFLTLLPAVRRGPDYVRGNGSPWGWPLFPWTLFGLLALAVPARALLLCWSLHWLDAGNFQRLIFGPYFLVPFGLAVAVLLLEVGLAPRGRAVLGFALAAPAGLVALTLIGHRDDPFYRQFLAAFSTRLGGSPLYLTLAALAGFYGYAALRRVPRALDGMTAVLLALAVVGPDTRGLDELRSVRPGPLLAAAALQLALGTWRRDSLRALLGAGVAAAAVVVAIPAGTALAALRLPVAFHLVLLAVLLVGAAFDDPLARSLRAVGTVFLLLAAAVALTGGLDLSPRVPPWAATAYPLVMAAVLAGYGLLWPGYRPARAFAAAVLGGWLAVGGVRSYAALRQVVAGLDYLVLSLGLFGVAVSISLGKSGALSAWLAARRARGADQPE